MYINISNLSKYYKENKILSNVSFNFIDNNKYVIKGENGIGKSTLIKAILNHVKYTGDISINGRISYSPENVSLPSYMTVYNFIKTLVTLTEKVEDFDKNLNKYFKLFNLDNKKKKAFIGSLSKGQRQKINLIQALLTPSDILILDEPFTGLDDESKNILVDLLIKDQRLIIIITHEIIKYKDPIFIKLELKNGKLNILF